MTLELPVETYLVKCVERFGGEAWKIDPKGNTGRPDRLVMLPGVAPFLVELKRPKGGRVSWKQQECHTRLRAIGVRVFVVKNFEEVDALLARVMAE